MKEDEDYTVVTWDWKRGPEIEELVNALDSFDIFVYPDPACEGTDSAGVIFSKKELTEDDLDKIDNRNCE